MAKKLFGATRVAIFALAFLGLGPAARASEIYLENSLFPVSGSSWGTEDDYVRALDLPDSEIPRRFQVKQKRNAVFASADAVRLADGRFIGNRVVFYKHIRFCMDSTLPNPNARFGAALESFLDSVAGTRANGRLFEISVLTVSAADAVNELCDILAVRGRWNQFPYRYLPDSKNPGMKPPLDVSRVYGLYYRASDDTIPVIAVHPDVKVSYSPLNGHYLSQHGKHVVIDGRALLLHELGHILGFAHIRPSADGLEYPEATAMGLDYSARDTRSIELRFRQAVDLWRYWDPFQTTVYRRLFQREMSPECNIPGPGFRPEPGNLLEKAVVELNDRVRSQHPWGAYALNLAMITDAVRSKIRYLPKSSCREYQSILAGVLPQRSQLVDFSDISRPGHRRFLYRLGSQSVAIGRDVNEFPEPDPESRFNYVCIQPGDRIYLASPAVSAKLGVPPLLPLYHSAGLFKGVSGSDSLFSFSPVPSIEITADLQTASDSGIRLDESRFLSAGGLLYSWVAATAQTTPVQGEVESLRLDLRVGEKNVNGNPISIDVRSNLRECQ